MSAYIDRTSIVRVKVIQLREKGRMRLRSEKKDSPAFVGDLYVGESRDPTLGRSVRRARLIDTSAGTAADVLPELNDAQLIWASNGEMRLNGYERVGDVGYAQTWSVRLVA